VAVTASAPISASVGPKATSTNKSVDVITVQKLLNNAGAGLKEDGDCGEKTVNAIRKYQSNFLAQPDGRVDPGGRTWRNLVEGKIKIKSTELVLLTQICGLGYYSYSAVNRQYGTKNCLQALRDVGGQFRRNLSDVEIGVGDISFQHGGYMSPHQSHQYGRNVDIRPLRKDKKHLPVTINDSSYSRDWTKLLVECLRAHRNVKSILFNDTNISGVTSWAGHDNHLHVSMKE
jgi:peptidoglycan hydrolase-like protein with peptidoglycan-binding domain